MGQLYAVASGKGGTGKTSVCAGLAAALAENGRKVLCVDCDVGLRNLDISLGMSDGSSLSFLEVCRGEYPLSAAPCHPAYPTLAFLTAPMNCLAGDIDSSVFSEVMGHAKECFDYVFLDAPAGVGSGFRLVSAAAEDFLLVTGSSPASLRDAARVGDLLELSGKTRVRLIVNRIDGELLHSLRLTIDDIMDAAGLPLAGIIPEDPEVTLAAAQGKPLLSVRRSCAASACRRIAGRLEGRYVPVPLR